MVMKSPNERLRANAGANQQIGGYGGSSMPSAAPFHSMVGQFEMAEKLKGASMDYLKKYVRNPSGNIPLYMVMAELQRRVDGQKRAQMADAAAKQQRPTVAQQVLDQVGSAPQEAGIPGAVTAFEQAQDAQKMASQTMAARSGGVIKFQNRGLVQSPFYYQELQRELDTLLAQPENLQPKPRIKQIYEELSTNPAAQTAGDVRRIDRQIDRENLGTMDYPSAAPPSPPPDQSNYQSMLDFARGDLSKTPAVTDAENRAMAKGMLPYVQTDVAVDQAASGSGGEPPSGSGGEPPPYGSRLMTRSDTNTIQLPKTDAYRAATLAEREKDKVQEPTEAEYSPKDRRKLSNLLSRGKGLQNRITQLKTGKGKGSKINTVQIEKLETELNKVNTEIGALQGEGVIPDQGRVKRRILREGRQEEAKKSLDKFLEQAGPIGIGREATIQRLLLRKNLSNERRIELENELKAIQDVKAGEELTKDMANNMLPPVEKTKKETTEEVDTNIGKAKPEAEPEAETEVKPEGTISSGGGSTLLDPNRNIDEQIQTQLPQGAAINQNTGSIDTGGQSPLEVYTDLIKNIKAKPTVIEQASLNQGKPSPFAEYRDFLDKQGLNRKKQDRFLDQMPLFNAALTALASNDPNVIRTIAAAGKSYLDTAMNIGERKRQLDSENAKTRFLLGQAESEFQRGERDFAFRLKKEANATALANRQVEFQIAGQTANLLASLEQTKATKELKQTQMENTAEARRQTAEIQKQGIQIRKDALNEQIRSRQASEALTRSVARLKAIDDRDAAVNAELGSQAGILRLQQKITELTDSEKSKQGVLKSLFSGVDDNRITLDAIKAVKAEIRGEYNRTRSNL
jgi:hypothetical protein